MRSSLSINLKQGGQNRKDTVSMEGFQRHLLLQYGSDSGNVRKDPGQELTLGRCPSSLSRCCATCHDPKRPRRGFPRVDHQSQSITLGNQTRKLKKYKQRQGPWRTPPSAWLPVLAHITPDHLLRGGTGAASRGLPHQPRIEETASTERPTSRSDGFNSSTDARSNKNWLSQAEAN